MTCTFTSPPVTIYVTDFMFAVLVSNITQKANENFDIALDFTPGPSRPESDYSFSWDSGAQTTKDATDLTPGPHMITVSDKSNAIYTCKFNFCLPGINIPDQIITNNIISGTNACENDGALDITITNSIPITNNSNNTWTADLTNSGLPTGHFCLTGSETIAINNDPLSDIDKIHVVCYGGKYYIFKACCIDEIITTLSNLGAQAYEVIAVLFLTYIGICKGNNPCGLCPQSCVNADNTICSTEEEFIKKLIKSPIGNERQLLKQAYIEFIGDLPKSIIKFVVS